MAQSEEPRTTRLTNVDERKLAHETQDRATRATGGWQSNSQVNPIDPQASPNAVPGRNSEVTPAPNGAADDGDSTQTVAIPERTTMEGLDGKPQGR